MKIIPASSGTRWRFRTRWPPSGSTTSWLSWTTSTAASPWRTTSCCSTTSARSRGTCRSDPGFTASNRDTPLQLQPRDRRFYFLCEEQLLNIEWFVPTGSVPGGSSPHGHDHLQKPEGGGEDPGQCKERRGKTCGSVKGRTSFYRTFILTQCIVHYCPNTLSLL